MPASLATVTQSTPTIQSGMLHAIRRLRGPNEVWMCDAHRGTCARFQRRRCDCGRCGFTGSLAQGLRHVAERQWAARAPLPKELQLTPEQEAA